MRRGNHKSRVRFERPLEDVDDEDDRRGGQMDLGSDEDEAVGGGVGVGGGEEEALGDVDFEYYPLHEGDWHSAKQHCAHLLDARRQWDVGSLATLVTEHSPLVGSAVKLGERDTQALAIGTVINMKQHAAVPAMQAIRDFVVARFNGETGDRVRNIFTDPHISVGLFINERVINLSPLLALQLHLSIFEEMEAANDAHRNISPNTRPPYHFDYLLFITVAFNESGGDSSAPRADTKRRRDKTLPFEWFKPEEEVYMKHAAFWEAWQVTEQDQASKWTFEGKITQSKVIMFVPTAEVPKILARFNEISDGDFEPD